MVVHYCFEIFRPGIGIGQPLARVPNLAREPLLRFNFLGDESWTLADVMTFFFIFALHLILGRKLDISGRDDLSIFSRENANCRLARGKIWPMVLDDFGTQIEKGCPIPALGERNLN